MGVSGTALGLTTSDGRRPRVALVGGSPASVLVAGVLVEQFGCSPITLPSAAAAIDRLKGDDAIDLMVADLTMSAMEGMCLIERIRSLGARGALPIVALAANRTALADPRVRAARFAATVVKPYSPRELYGALHMALVGPAKLVAQTG
jgi:CheY-like chemotaxis protein